MPGMRAAALPLLAAVLAAACRAPTAAPGPPAERALQVEPFPAPVAQYLNTRVAVRQRLVLTDAAAWARLWGEATAGYHPRPPVPAVDFAADVVVVAAMGTRASGGYSIHIDRAYEADGRLHVVVREVTPGPRCATTAALTAPLTAVRVARGEAPVLFVERAETLACD